MNVRIERRDARYYRGPWKPQQVLIGGVQLPAGAKFPRNAKFAIHRNEPIGCGNVRIELCERGHPWGLT
jgi:hypothetical protein